VRVDVDAAGHDEKVGGVDEGVARGVDAGRDFGDALAFDEDVELAGAFGGDDGAVFDQGSHGYLMMRLGGFDRNLAWAFCLSFWTEFDDDILVERRCKVHQARQRKA